MAVVGQLGTKIGFFHFGTNHEEPLRSLQEALLSASQEEDVSGALIVLPEAMNIKRGYRDGGRIDISPVIIDELSRVAETHGILLVAGLIIGDESSVKPYSAAYIIGPQEPEILCCKEGNDNYENYRPYPGLPDLSNPFEYGGLRIVAIICMDVQNSNRCRKLLAGASTRTVVCIPACMESSCFGGGKRGQLVNWGDGVTVPTILANSDPTGCSSFITDHNGYVTHSFTGPRNKIMLSQMGPNQGEDTGPDGWREGNSRN